MPTEPKPVAVVIDIDGTVADHRHREHLIAGAAPNWGAFFANSGLDDPLPEGITLAIEHTLHSIVIWLTGRPERYRQLTADWLAANGLPTANLNMRPDNDVRSAAIFKAERLAQLSAMYDIALVVDDDEQVVATLRQAGWPVHHAQWMPR